MHTHTHTHTHTHYSDKHVHTCTHMSSTSILIITSCSSLLQFCVSVWYQECYSYFRGCFDRLCIFTSSCFLFLPSFIVCFWTFLILEQVYVVCLTSEMAGFSAVLSHFLVVWSWLLPRPLFTQQIRFILFALNTSCSYRKFYLASFNYNMSNWLLSQRTLSGSIIIACSHMSQLVSIHYDNNNGPFIKHATLCLKLLKNVIW